MRKFVFVSTFIFCLFFFNNFNSQKAQAQEAVANIQLQVAVPQGEFRDQLEEIGFGLNGMIGYMLPNSPLVLGLDMGFITFGSETRTEPLSPTIPDLRVEVENSYNMFHAHFLARVTGRDETFRPFVDFLVGFNYLFTQTTVRSRGSMEDVFTDTNFDDFALSYGLGAGMKYRVYQDRNTGSRVYINLQGRYLIGNDAEYLRPGSVVVENGDVSYDVRSSSTNLLYIQLGASIAF